MSATTCPELEQLFDAVIRGEGPELEHALECEACSAVLEEHRQLEKDLYRMVDPLPPPDLVRNVMTQVAAQPAPLRRELAAGLGILGGALALGGGILLRDPQMLGQVGLAFTSALTDGQQAVPSLFGALGALWSAVGVTGVAVCSSLLLVSLLGLKRLSGGPATSEA